ncbi:MAG: radical SAM protein [Oscillospiraceae bacterium]|nr:radical SAM protein [Oscillospiraceae bacterium]
MKNREDAYLREAALILGLPEGTAAFPFPMEEETRCFLPVARDELCRKLSAEPLRPLAREEIPLPELLEPLRGHFRRRGALYNNNVVWIPCRKHDEVLDSLTERGLIDGPLRERLRTFLALRPCFYPALHPGLALVLDRESGRVFPAALLLEGFGAAKEGFRWPLAMNLELTTQCPLRCPQCYVHLQAGRHMPREIALRRLDQAGELGVVTVNLSGGETMCYPWLFDAIERARSNDIEADVALSGFGINDRSLDRLIGAGVSGIYVSINGPTAETNAKTRDGFELAMELLRRLRDQGFANTNINWVVHDSNAALLPDMIRLAEEHAVHSLMIMAFKPDSQNALPSLPSREQMERLACQIRDYEGPVELNIESCYSSLRALTYQSFFGNRNTGPFLGCGAGRDSFSVALDGRLTPCRHIDIREEFDHIGDYWDKSPVLKQIRQAQRDPADPCRGCRFADACRHCMAVNLKLHGSLSRGDGTCPLGSAYQKEATHV